DARYFVPEFLEFHAEINFLKAGLVFADALTTVSPRYAGEIQTPAFGEGLDGVLRARHAALRGILNGIDDAVWNPATDPHLVARFPGRVGARVGFDEGLAHRIEAGADVFLMPSRFEPCGLNQLYSLRYGTVPIVHATGGLDDSVVEFDPATGAGTGFKFSPYTPEAFLAALARALRTRRDPALWAHLIANGMAQDFSWSRAAAEYRALYETLVGGRGV